MSSHDEQAAPASSQPLPHPPEDYRQAGRPVRMTAEEVAAIAGQMCMQVAAEFPDASVNMKVNYGISETMTAGQIVRCKNETATVSFLINGGAQDARLAPRAGTK